MNEQQKDMFPEEDFRELDTEKEITPDQTAQEETQEHAAETAEEHDWDAVQVMEEAQMPNPEPAEDFGGYRGKGTGRKESPFADSPYVMRHHVYREAPVQPVYRAPEPTRKEKKGSGLGRRILAAVGVLLLVVGSCGVTAHMVNSRWEQRFDALQDEIQVQVEMVRNQVDKLAPQSTGISVSGTAAQGTGLTAGQVYAQNVQSVVLIESTVTANMYGQTATGVASGSGFILTEDGYVVTNYHVIEGASSVAVVLHDGKRYPAAVTGYDSTNDIAVLKVDAQGLDAVEIGSSSDLIVGDQVVAIGNPLGELTSTLTVGYVSAKERTVSTDGTIINMIQTDAAINSGNSGGPLFNMKGQVVGITTAKYSGASASGATIEGIGFAIPMDDVMGAVEELIQNGYIKSAYLGVMVQNMDPSAASIYGLPVGAYVVGVEEGYCAQRSGIREKDIIVAVGDVKISVIADLTRALRAYAPGDVVEIKVYRAGMTKSIYVKLDERPRDTAVQQQPQPQPEGQMPEGNYDEWFDFFAPFFGRDNDD